MNTYKLRTEKNCPSCNTIKKISDFHKSKERIDGLQGRCKSCMNRITRNYIYSEKGKVTQYKYKHSEKGIISRDKTAKKTRLKFPEKHKARMRIRTAIENGNIVSPKSLQCKYCPSQANHYHHYNGYKEENWFDIFPVCTKCHGKIHAGYIL